MTETLINSNERLCAYSDELPDEYERAETPRQLYEEHPLDPDTEIVIADFRQTTNNIRKGLDPRLDVAIRPCSLDDSIQPDGTFSYLKFLERVQTLRGNPIIAQYLFLGSGIYPAKPRTDETDFRGLEQRDLVTAHDLVVTGANMQVPLRSEAMSKDHIARYGDCLTSIQVGARDVGSTLLRHTLSCYDIPTYCKNADSGKVGPALKAMKTIAAPHVGAEILLPDGTVGRRRGASLGNQNVGLIYRGGDDVITPEQYQAKVIEVSNLGIPYQLDNAHGPEMVYDKHGKKSVEGQIAAFEDNLRLMYSGKLGALPVGMMLEVYLLEGADITQQTPGKSWTDPCIGIAQAEEMVLELARVHGKLMDRA